MQWLLRRTQAAFSLGLIFLTPALRPCWHPYQCHIPVWLMGIDSCSPLRGHQAPLLPVLLGSSLPTLREIPSQPQHAPTGSQLDTAGRPSAGLQNSLCVLCPWALDHVVSLDCTQEMLGPTPASCKRSSQFTEGSMGLAWLVAAALHRLMLGAGEGRS